jgi:hypothetical protein
MSSTRRAWHFHLSLNSILLLLPLPVLFKWPSLRWDPYTPRHVIYAHDFKTLLLAPFAFPTSTSSFVSRLIQSVIVYPFPSRSVAHCYALWIYIALARILTGFILSRAVGWALPALFNHYALYETSEGFGPSIVLYLGLVWVSTSEPHDITIAGYSLGGSGDGGSPSKYAVPITAACLCGLLAWLDSAPWTYATAVVTVPVFIAAHAVISSAMPQTRQQLYHLVALNHSLPAFHRLRVTAQTTVLSLLLICIPNLAYNHFSISPDARAAANLFLTPTNSSLPPSPLLEILILSHPRPRDVSMPSILSRTIASYEPLLDFPSISISVFTQTPSHPSFTRAAQDFAGKRVRFHSQQGPHPSLVDGQYLHTAEAFRWVMYNRTLDQVPEWVMLVEDDFPVCGEWGREGIRMVMGRLESGRSSLEGQGEVLRSLAGFVGTGGRCVTILCSYLAFFLFSKLRLVPFFSAVLCSIAPSSLYSLSSYACIPRRPRSSPHPCHCGPQI